MKKIFAKLTFDCVMCKVEQSIDVGNPVHKYNYTCTCEAQYWINYQRCLVKYVRGGKIIKT